MTCSEVYLIQVFIIGILWGLLIPELARALREDFSPRKPTSRIYKRDITPAPGSLSVTESRPRRVTKEEKDRGEDRANGIAK